jgi:uncharacterized membrane protein
MLTNHVPIIGTFFALLVLAAGMIKNSPQIKSLGYLLIVVSVVGGLVALYTGEAAEEVVEGLQGVSEKSIHDHEEAGELAMGFLYTTGIAAILALILGRMVKFQNLISYVVMLAGLGLFGTSARAGYYGGQIRHTELHAAPVSADGGGVNQINDHEHQSEDEGE